MESDHTVTLRVCWKRRSLIFVIVPLRKGPWAVWPARGVREGDDGAATWFDVRPAFTDGACVELLAVVSGGSVSIEGLGGPALPGRAGPRAVVRSRKRGTPDVRRLVTSGVEKARHRRGRITACPASARSRSSAGPPRRPPSPRCAGCCPAP
ncbi:DUF6214 family protein [Streptomyces sp. NPDC002588]|uniref:DUF6214 family protein n=1 Tax=Streptomyces sp. NPDC002588 TaxID=3154419 RepID=UPI003316BE76